MIPTPKDCDKMVKGTPSWTSSPLPHPSLSPFTSRYCPDFGVNPSFPAQDRWLSTYDSCLEIRAGTVTSE